MAQPGAFNTCSFCNKASANAIAGPIVFICFSCAVEYAEALKLPPAPTPRRQTEPPACSFCGEAEPAVQRVLSGREASICNGCLALCNDIRAGRNPC